MDLPKDTEQIIKIVAELIEKDNEYSKKTALSYLSEYRWEGEYKFCYFYNC